MVGARVGTDTRLLSVCAALQVRPLSTRRDCPGVDGQVSGPLNTHISISLLLIWALTGYPCTCVAGTPCSGVVQGRPLVWGPLAVSRLAPPQASPHLHVIYHQSTTACITLHTHQARDDHTPAPPSLFASVPTRGRWKEARGRGASDGRRGGRREQGRLGHSGSESHTG
jgi:hypothetical protein